MVQIFNHYQSNLFKRSLQFLVSMSLVSLLLFFSLYQNSSFNLVCHRFPSFFHTLERKYMFLICNGILAILAKSSFSSGTSSSNDGATKPLTTNLYVSKSANNDQEVALEIYTDESLEDVALMTQLEEQQQEENTMVVLAEESQEGEEEESECLLYVEEDENDDFFEEQQQEESSIKDLREEVAEDYEEEESNEELTSTEEMNRRFEEFIRKMKEEIRIEAQSQLISV